MRHILVMSRMSLVRAAVTLACAVLVSGCLGGGHYASGPDYSPESHDYLRVDTHGAYAECVAACSQNTSLALVTRTGCLDGCAQAAASYPLADKTFSTRDACLDALLQTELDHAGRIAEMRRWCDAKWSHVHNRKGCYTAANIFYAALSPESVCGSDITQAQAYDASLAAAREKAARDANPAPHETAVVPLPEPSFTSPQDAVNGQTGREKSGGQTETLGMQASPANLSGTPGSDANASPTPPVSRVTQPAGPVVPPPLEPQLPVAPSSPAPPAAKEQPVQPSPGAATPEIHDTPKYRREAAATPRRASSSQAARVEKTPAASDKQQGSTAPVNESAGPKEKNDAPAPTPQATDSRPDPALTVQPSPSGSLPLTPESANGPPHAPAQATAPSPALPQPGKNTAAETPVLSRDPAAAQTLPASVPAPERAGSSERASSTNNGTVSPGLPAGQRPATPQPLEGAPQHVQPVEPAQSGREPSVTAEPQQPARPKLHLPPIPEPRPNAATEQSQPALMPPVPSMLHQPYNAPTIISPQIDVPPETPRQ